MYNLYICADIPFPTKAAPETKNKSNRGKKKGRVLATLSMYLINQETKRRQKF
jgi:hypothetical protein